MINNTHFVAVMAANTVWASLAYTFSDMFIFNPETYLPLFENVSTTIQNLSTFYAVLFFLNLFKSWHYATFLDKNPNLIKTKSNSFSIIYHILEIVYDFHTASNAILMFVASIYFFELGRTTNIKGYLAMLLVAFVQGLYQYYWVDHPIHLKNEITELIDVNGKITMVPARSLKEGDYFLKQGNGDDGIHHEDDGSIRVSSARLVSKFALVNNTSQTGEPVLKRLEENSKLQEGQIIVSNGVHSLQVLECMKPKKQAIIDSNIKNIMFYLTLVALVTTFLLTTCIFMCIKDNNQIDIVLYILTGIRTFIGNNCLFPAFKIAVNLIFLGTTYVIICKLYGFRVNNIGKNINQQFLPGKTLICSDKTGTLTMGDITIDCSNSSSEFKDDEALLVASHCQLAKTRKGTLSQSCAEDVTVGEFVLEKTGYKSGRNHNFSNKNEVLTFTKNGNNIEIIQLKYVPFSREHECSSSLLKCNNKFYHLITTSLDKMKKVDPNFAPQFNSMDRCFVYVMTELPEEDSFEDSLDNFKNNTNFPYTVVGEFHFPTVFRQKTVEASKRLYEEGVMIAELTGDRVETAFDVMKKLGLDSIVDINGEMFGNMPFEEQFSYLERILGRNINGNVLPKINIAAGKMSPKSKKIFATIAKSLGWNVIGQGDQLNDYDMLDEVAFANCQQDGAKECADIASVVSIDPTYTTYCLLILGYMNMLKYGPMWYIKQLVRFNYTTTGVWLIGIIANDFKTVSLVFDDPWDAAGSFIMSASISIICIFLSVCMKHTPVKEDTIYIYTPIKSFCVAVFGGYLLSQTGLVYNNFSLYLITFLSLVPSFIEAFFPKIRNYM